MARKIFIYIAALIVFFFSVGPLFLTFLGSVIPDASLLSFPPKWFARKPTLAYYDYIFTGKVPQSLRSEGRFPKYDHRGGDGRSPGDWAPAPPSRWRSWA